MSEITNWREMLDEAFSETGDSWENVISSTLSDEELDSKFDRGYGGTEGKPFTVWTHKNVYFPICYDGAEWAGHASRNPDGLPTEHQGGG